MMGFELKLELLLRRVRVCVGIWVRFEAFLFQSWDSKRINTTLVLLKK